MQRLLTIVLLGSLLLSACATQTARADNRFLITQKRPFDCGPAALATLLYYYLGVPTDEDEIARLSGANATIGTTLLGLEHAATAKNAAAGSFRMDYATLQQQVETYGTPVIVRTLNPEPHFSLVLAAENDYVFLADPARGNIMMRKTAFLERWLIVGRPSLSTPPTTDNSEGYVFVATSNQSEMGRARRLQMVQQLKVQIERLNTARLPMSTIHRWRP